MKICFDLGIQDLVAFTRYHQDRTPAVRRVRLFVTLVFGVAPAVIIPPLIVPQEYRAFALAGGVFAAAILAFRMPDAYSRSTERQVRRLYRGKTNEGVFGPHELELTATSLVKRTPVSESSTRLEALGPVILKEDYTFIYASPVTAFVIPRHAIRSGDYDQFAAAASERISEANPPPLPGQRTQSHW
jgi:hypothetical protein